MTHTIYPTSIIMRLREKLPPEYAQIVEDELRPFWERERKELWARAKEARKLANLLDAHRYAIEDELYADKRTPYEIKVGNARVTLTVDDLDFLNENELHPTGR